MRKWIIAALLIAAFAGCSSTPTEDTAATDDKAAATAPGAGATTSGATTSGATTSGAPAGAVTGAPRFHPGQRAQGSQEHPVEAQHLFRLRPVHDQGRVQAHRRSAREVPAGESRCARDPPGQHRRARDARIQHRAGAEARRRGEEPDAAAGRHRNPDRDGELRQGEAAPRGPRRGVVGGEPPRRHRPRRRVSEASERGGRAQRAKARRARHRATECGRQTVAS